MMKELPPEVHESETWTAIDARIEAFLNQNVTSERSSLPESMESDHQNVSDASPLIGKSHNMRDQVDTMGATDLSRTDGTVPEDSSRSSNASDNEFRTPEASTTISEGSHRSSIASTNEILPQQNSEHDFRTPTASTKRNEADKEIIEQFEHGVYVTFIQRPNGVKIFKRVKFRYYDYMVDPIELYYPCEYRHRPMDQMVL